MAIGIFIRFVMRHWIIELRFPSVSNRGDFLQNSLNFGTKWCIINKIHLGRCSGLSVINSGQVCPICGGKVNEGYWEKSKEFCVHCVDCNFGFSFVKNMGNEFGYDISMQRGKKTDPLEKRCIYHLPMVAYFINNDFPSVWGTVSSVDKDFRNGSDIFRYLGLVLPDIYKNTTDKNKGTFGYYFDDDKWAFKQL